jgi:hypothetical protein
MAATLSLISMLFVVGGQVHATAPLPGKLNPVFVVQEAGWAPGPVWTGAEYLAPSAVNPVFMNSRWIFSWPLFHEKILFRNKS